MGILCYKLFALPVKLCSILRKWTWISCQCELQTSGQLLKKNVKKSTIDMLREERKCNNIKCSLKTKEARNTVEGNKRNKEQGQRIENSKKYGRC